MAMQGASYIRVPTGARTELSSAAQSKAIKAYAASNGIALLPAISMDEGNAGGGLLITRREAGRLCPAVRPCRTAISVNPPLPAVFSLTAGFFSV